MHRFEQLKQKERILWDLIALRYPQNVFLFKKAVSFLKKRNPHVGQNCLWYQNCIVLALDLVNYNLDFEIILSAFFYIPVKQEIVTLGECKATLDTTTLDHLEWFIGVENLRNLCIRILDSREDETCVYPNLSTAKLAVVLALCLNKMRMIDLLPSSQEREVLAKDGLEIYSPIAEQVGIADLKTEIEDISFGVFNPEARAVLVEILEAFQKEYESALQYVVEKLEKRLVGAGIKGKMTWRQKSPYSIWLKMLKKRRAFDNISDVLGLRIIVNTLSECYQALGIVHSDYVVVSGFFDDFVNVPKSNGYQSIHTVILGPLNHKIEVQIRTNQMHAQSEKGRASHWIYKNQDNSINMLEDAKSLLFDLKTDSLNQVSCTLADGSTIYLPHGGIVLDVSFKISYAVGMSCIGAKIDGKNVSLLCQIKEGDRVEIFTADWHEIDEACQYYVVDPEVGEYIKKYFLDKNWAKNVHSGERTLKNLCNWFRVPSFDDFAANLARDLRLESKEVLFSSIAQGKISVSKLILSMDPEYGYGGYLRKLSNFLKLNLAKLSLHLIKRINVSEQKTEIAKCCNPIPGDKIIGFFTILEGLSVHWVYCPKLIKIPINAKFVPMRLEDKGDAFFVDLEIIFLHTSANLESISSLIEKFDGHIANIKHSSSMDAHSESVYTIQVFNEKQTSVIMAHLKDQKDIYSVKRVRFND